MSDEMTNWELKLSRVVLPIRSEPLHTLSDARAYILSLPRGTRNQDDWERAADLLMAAVASASEIDVEQATFQIERALLFHKLLAPR
jgi:phage-related baseplate assembly protein